ncbi:hypothetical protein BSLG_000887 [Batrachochytrium salamandrivorans]|nr:hypothetical protein BSLG_000887 [Batrachochytrium salamandrivorans]
METTPAVTCKVCHEPISGSHVSTKESKYHKDCFVCHQCLEPFKDNVFFEADGAFYCESDHNLLHGARCAKCGEVVMGKCVSALDAKWHIEHFNCESCGKPLMGSTFVRKDDLPYCKSCPSELSKKEKQNQRNVDPCENCKLPISQGAGIVFRGQHFHAAHFTCAVCKEVLTSTAHEYEGVLFCQTDYAKTMGQICYACRRPIVGRSKSAIGKIYHPEHFVCWKCDKPFDGAPHFELQSRPYCEAHYKELTGSVCSYCRSAAKGNANSKAQFMEWDNRPMCKRCYEKLSSDVRKCVSKYKESEKKFLPILDYGR